MAKAPLMQGQLLFAQFDEHGIAPPVTPEIPANIGRLQLALTLSRQKAQSPPTYQVQTLSIGYAPVSAQQQASLRALFIAARAEYHGNLSANWRAADDAAGFTHSTSFGPFIRRFARPCSFPRGPRPFRPC